MALSLPLSIIFFHWLCDWFFQNDWMALNKSKSDLKGLLALSTHTLVATSYCILWGVGFWFINSIAHFATDFVTSRVNARLWFIELEPMVIQEHGRSHFATVDVGKRHWFFVSIGFDQLIHYATLTVTYSWLAYGG